MDAIRPSAPQAQAPTGIRESTAQVPVPIPTAPKGAHHSSGPLSETMHSEHDLQEH